ncbi:hypothetical protein KP509_18G034900 [Ceratopteris richardii]|uniref:Uncharacterized protein n=1 Tax=Ceratopteris richardii TaxID=49495 RepID=A0A8T2SSE3_CERRI|nr:hypothetical protein KP509_18G034900 [Ceratopteris richardii]
MNFSADLRAFMAVMGKVYGELPAAGSSIGNWRPQAFATRQRRYLWTDAYGVCNFITLFKESGGNPLYLDLADALINDVHETLGRHRDGRSRLGSSTDEHPLLGGLRIGKQAEEFEEDGDGQYFHYLTKWMFALNRMSIARGNERYNDLAIELAKAVHSRFVYDTDKERPRMHWKMNINLTRPLVRSEGNLDPFDGYMTYRVLAEHCNGSKAVLDNEINEMWKMVQAKYRLYISGDPLDLGEALWICHWFVDEKGKDSLGKEEWAMRVSNVSLQALERLHAAGYFTTQPKGYRLAFREFGTTIGVQVNSLANLHAWMPRVKEIHAFWSDKLYKRDRDITPVMYCTSLIPGAFKKGYF